MPEMEIKIRMKGSNINNKTKDLITDGHQVKVSQIKNQVHSLIELILPKRKIRNLKAKNHQKVWD